MRIPGIETDIESKTVCRFFPVFVSLFCALIYSFSQFLDITWGYTVFAILVVGFLSSLYLTFLLQEDEKITVSIDAVNESVFEETDPAESMLLNIEAIVLEVNNLSAKQIDVSRIQIEDAVTAIVDRFVHLNEHLSELSFAYDLQDDDEMHRLQASLADILISFQFQDRTSQILQHVSNSLEMFTNEIKSIQALRKKGGQPDYDKDDILKKITKGFSTEEQRAMMPGAQKDPPSNDIEFF